MPEPVSLDELRTHVRADGSDEDALLQSLIVAARRAIENRTGVPLIGEGVSLSEDDIGVAKVAILLLAGHWFVHREPVAVGVTVAEMPMTVEYLIEPLSKMAV